MSRQRLIEDKIIKTGKVKWRRFKFLQKESFKEITKKQMDKLKASILNNDFIETFKVWEHDGKVYCLDGYHRCLALSELAAEGYQVPEEFTANFVQCKDMKDAAKKVLVYSSIYASVTDEGLYEFSHDFNLNFDEIKFEIDIPKLDLDRYEAGYVRDDDYNEEEDNVPEPPAEPTTKVGDLYLLGGRHRLLCGDSTDKSNLDKLLSGSSIDLVLTDPPYGIDLDTSWLSALHVQSGKPANKSDKKIIGDDCRPDLSLLSTYPKRIVFGFPYLNDVEATGWLVWDKQPGVARRGIVTPVELAYTTCWKGFDIIRCMWGGFYRDLDLNEQRVEHTTQKPLKLIKPLIVENVEENGVVGDFYGGSGTTLIACEQTNRTCFMSEIEPAYCDVIIERYKNLTGKDVELIESIGRAANEQ